jgi:hypothetical protein
LETLKKKNIVLFRMRDGPGGLKELEASLAKKYSKKFRSNKRDPGFQTSQPFWVAGIVPDP